MDLGDAEEEYACHALLPQGKRRRKCLELMLLTLRTAAKPQRDRQPEGRNAGQRSERK